MLRFVGSAPTRQVYGQENILPGGPASATGLVLTPVTVRETFAPLPSEKEQTQRFLLLLLLPFSPMVFAFTVILIPIPCKIRGTLECGVGNLPGSSF